MMENDAQVARAMHNLFLETLDREYAKECVVLYGLREAADAPGAPVEDNGNKTSETWFQRFWKYAGDIREEEIYQVWGKVLAGEIRKPGTFSLKTLDILYNLDKKDVVVLKNLAPYVISDFFIPMEACEKLKLNTYTLKVYESLGLFIRSHLIIKIA